MSRTRRVGAVVIVGAVVAVIWSAVPGRGQGPTPVKPQKGRHFVRLGDTYFNVDHITRAEISRAEPLQLIASFTEGPRLVFSGEQAERLKAVLDGKRFSPVKVDAAANAKPAPAVAPEDERFLVYDGFEGKLGLNWKPVRPDPTHVSLTKNPGKLTITTQRGSIHGDEKNDAIGEGVQAKNLYLIDNPLAADADFVATTCVVGFVPEMSYQQAGLIVYNDDDNYLKFGYEYNWPKEGGQAFCILTEIDAQSNFKFIESSEAGLKRYWVRLTKRGDRYQYATSTDGKEFRTHGEVTWGDGAPKRIGIIAKNGGNKEAGELDAAFEFFELRAPRAKE